MHCHTCQSSVSLARKVCLREADGGPFAVAFVCTNCYPLLDTTDGVGLIDGGMYQLDEPSRFGKAPLYTAEMFEDWLRAKAVKLEADAK